jgi:eukaryotic-like serine/threonine-protein kinase
MTADGLPYFAMEFVDGEPIDGYCTARRAHHRAAARSSFVRCATPSATRISTSSSIATSSPPNILVTADGQVKLLDFGIATLLGGARGGGDATHTEFMALTPEVAAPEQVLGTAVSTATDVYSLGVLLYLLLTGVRPYELRGKPLSEIERIVCEIDPPKPSSRVAAPWEGRLRGDLDTIVMKALRKEPAQRYGSVQDLAADIRRHLSGHPVHARRLTTGYRARRFAKRHAWGVAAASAFVLLVSAYAMSMTVQQRRVRRALEDARTGALRAEQVTDFMLGLFQASEHGEAFADTLLARDLLRRGVARAREETGQPEVRAQMLDAVGHIHVQLGEYRQARAVFEEALAARREVLRDDHADVATSFDNIAAAAQRTGDTETARQLWTRALAVRRATLGTRHRATLETQYSLANALHAAGYTDVSEPLFDEWIVAVAAQSPEVTEYRAVQFVLLAQLLSYRGEHEDALRFLTEAVEIRRQVNGERHVSVARALSVLAGAYLAAGRLDDAERAERQSVSLMRDLYPDGHPDLADAIRGLAVSLHRLGRWDEAESLYLEQMALARRFYGDEHVFVGNTSEDLGILLRRRELHDRAEPYLRDAVRLYRASFGPSSLMTRRAEVLLGDVLRRKGYFAEAEPLLLAGYEAFRERRIPGFDFALPIAVEGLAELYRLQNRTEEATRFRALLPNGTAPR